MRLAAATSLETPKLNLGEKFLKMCSDQALNSTSSETNSDSDITNRSSAILETGSTSTPSGSVAGLTTGHQSATTAGSIQPNLEQMRNIQILINSLRLNQQTSGIGQSNIQSLLMPNYQSSSVSLRSFEATHWYNS